MDWATVNLSVSLPGPMHRFLRSLRNGFRKKVHNLLGDRDVEWSFVASRMPQGPGEALDFGPGGSALALIAAERGFQVTAVDLESIERHYEHPNLTFVQGDLLALKLPQQHYDLILNCSSVEHVGLAGRYGIREAQADGDLQAMAVLRGVMKAGAVMLLTVPVGRDAVFAANCRVYGERRLPKLLAGLQIIEERFWIKNGVNRWVAASRSQATAFDAAVGNGLRTVYALGCFVLRREA